MWKELIAIRSVRRKWSRSSPGMLIYGDSEKRLVVGVVNRNLPAAIPICEKLQWKSNSKNSIYETHPSQVHSMLPQEFYCESRAANAWALRFERTFRDRWPSYRFATVSCCTDYGSPEVVSQCASLTFIGIVSFWSAFYICAPCVTCQWRSW